MEIEYDARKNDDNLAKHGVTLDEAAEVWNGVVVNILQLGRLLRKRGVSTMTKRITSEEFDTRFDAGEDLDDYLDYDAVTVEDATPRDVLLSLPEWAIITADQEAKRRNITRRAILNTWITDKADEVRMHATA